MLNRTVVVVSRNLFAACFVSLLGFSGCSIFAADEKAPAVAAPVDEAAAKKAFATDYEAGAVAISDKNWSAARQHLSNALKALGDFNDPKKSTAQVLLNKAERALVKDDALYTASELMRLKQWVEAEEAFRKVVDVSGETETLRKNILTCRAGLEADSAELRTAAELLRARKWKDATIAYNKASDILGGIRMIRDGLNSAQLGAESDELLLKGAAMLKNKQWDEAFNAYKRLFQIVGETDEVKKGVAAAQAGYAAEHKAAPEAPPGPGAPAIPAATGIKP